MRAPPSRLLLTCQRSDAPGVPHWGTHGAIGFPRMSHLKQEPPTLACGWTGGLAGCLVVDGPDSPDTFDSDSAPSMSGHLMDGDGHAPEGTEEDRYERIAWVLFVRRRYPWAASHLGRAPSL
jgi:hypothetical protein